MGADDRQTLRAFLEAQSFAGPSLIIAYSPCIAHGYDLRFGLDQQDRAVRSGYWPLYRFDPRRSARGENPLQLDSKSPSLPLADYMYVEGRFRVLTQSHPQRAAELLLAAERDVREQWSRYQRMAQPSNGQGTKAASSESALAKSGEE
jgi:pyruvate-ferredoxin/flavodoxin oxidoreductase